MAGRRDGQRVSQVKERACLNGAVTQPAQRIGHRRAIHCGGHVNVDQDELAAAQQLAAPPADVPVNAG